MNCIATILGKLRQNRAFSKTTLDKPSQVQTLHTVAKTLELSLPDVQHPLSSDHLIMVCHNCLAQLGHNGGFCDQCGEQVQNEKMPRYDRAQTPLPIRAPTPNVMLPEPIPSTGDVTVMMVYEKTNELIELVQLVVQKMEDCDQSIDHTLESIQILEKNLTHISRKMQARDKVLVNVAAQLRAKEKN